LGCFYPFWLVWPYIFRKLGQSSVDKEKKMRKPLAKLLSVLALSASLLLSQVGSIQAQGNDPTATPTTSVAAVSDPDEINFTMLRQTDL
jgi:hypothetical protein